MKWDLTLLWRGFITAVVLASTSVVLGSVLAGVWWMSFLIIIVGSGWWITQRNKQTINGIQINESMAFALFLAVTAYAGYLGVAPIWLLFAGIAALLAWDLVGFYQQLTTTTLIVGEEQIVKAHCQQLLSVAAISLILGIIVLLIQINFNFLVAFLLAFLAIWGVGLVLGQVGQRR